MLRTNALSVDSSVEDLFRKALRLDKRGDWAEAIALHEQIASSCEPKLPLVRELSVAQSEVLLLVF